MTTTPKAHGAKFSYEEGNLREVPVRPSVQAPKPVDKPPTNQLPDTTDDF